ncbi:MAG: arginine--tRNA ligase [Mycoplasmatales bacterium]|nr:arginine--tRNA ligase [Mycoplasmatales bacterium]
MKNKIIKVIEEAVNKIGGSEKVELTDSRGHGDFSTNIAMKLTKQFKESPITIANKIIENINEDFIENLEIAGPGFINIFLTETFFSQSINKILKEKNHFAKGNQNKYINIEYVSANPTGYLHIGHARSAVIGSSLKNILVHAGNKVDAEYYINDAGNQINVLGESVKVRYLQALGIEAELPEASYGGSDIISVANGFKKKYGNKWKDKSIKDFALESKDILLEIIKMHLKEYRVEFDIWSSEQSIYDKNLINPSIEKLKKYTYEKDGALWLKTTAGGDDKDRVLVKSDGKYTYFMPDISYHDVKLSRNYDELINIWGADHIGYIKRMSVALNYLGLPDDKLDIFTVQLVKLFKDGKELKMSKRMGTSFTIKELIEEVGVDAARWFMIDRSNSSEFIFNINLATEKSSNNPVFSVQYSHARANQLIEKSQIESKPGKYNKKEKEIINLLNSFPDLIEKIANSHKVHLLPQYLLELTNLFNSWYTNNKAIGSANEASSIALAKAFKIVASLGLSLLNISAPEKM